MISKLIRLIAALDSKNGIAAGGHMPWHIPADLARFNDLTTSHGANILIGNNTYRSIGHALANRHNYVLTHNNDQIMKDAVAVNDLNKLINNFHGDLWVIGGEQVYAQTINFADELYLTIIDHDYHCDQFFPDYRTSFLLVSSEGPYSHNGIHFSYQLLEKI